jgi:hypothetical protein
MSIDYILYVCIQASDLREWLFFTLKWDWEWEQKIFQEWFREWVREFANSPSLQHEWDLASYCLSHKITMTAVAWSLNLPSAVVISNLVDTESRALRDWLFDFGRDRDRFFAQMSVFGRDWVRFRDWRKSSFFIGFFGIFFNFFKNKFRLFLTCHSILILLTLTKDFEKGRTGHGISYLS